MDDEGKRTRVDDVRSLTTRPSILAGLKLYMAEWLAVAILLAFAALVLVLSAPLATASAFGPGPGFFAHYLGLILLGLCLVRVVMLARLTLRSASGRAVARDEVRSARPEAVGIGPQEAAKPDWWGAARFAILVAALFAYPPLLGVVGFILATSALSWTLLVVLGRRPLRALVEAVAAVIALKFGFSELLDVPLPPAGIDALRAIGL